MGHIILWHSVSEVVCLIALRRKGLRQLVWVETPTTKTFHGWWYHLFVLQKYGKLKLTHTVWFACHSTGPIYVNPGEWGLYFITILPGRWCFRCASDAVEWSSGDWDNPFPLEGGHLLRSPHVVVGAVAQPMVVALAPSEHGTGAGQGNTELRTAFNLGT